MSLLIAKKLSHVISNTNPNTYRALQIMMEQSKAKNELRSCNSISPNQSTSYSKVSFLSKQNRFQYHDKSVNNGSYLKGNLKLYNVTKISGDKKWEGFVSSTTSDLLISEPFKQKLTYRKMKKRNSDIMESKRTIVPKFAQELIPSEKHFSKRVFQNKQKLSSLGSMDNLFSKTPGLEKKYRKHSEKLLLGNDIFVPATPDYKRHKMSVKLDQIRMSIDYAGKTPRDRHEERYSNDTTFRYQY